MLTAGAGAGGGGSSRSRSASSRSSTGSVPSGRSCAGGSPFWWNSTACRARIDGPHRVVDRGVDLGVADDRRGFGQLGAQLGDAGVGRRPGPPAAPTTAATPRRRPAPGRRPGPSAGGGSGHRSVSSATRAVVRASRAARASASMASVARRSSVARSASATRWAQASVASMRQPCAAVASASACSAAAERSSARRSGFTALRRSVPTASPLKERSRSSAAPAVDSALRVVAACWR